MRISTAVFIALGAALSLGGQAFAQTAQLVGPAAENALQISPSAVVVPQSSRIQRAGFMHTNTRFIPPSTLQTLSAQAARDKRAPLVESPVPGIVFETPASLACIYGLVTPSAGCNPITATAVPTTKGSKAIAIVDAFHYSSALADLKKFSQKFGLPAPKLVVKYATATGRCDGPAPQADLGWAIEAALDVQMAHAMAPAATIILVEAQSNFDADLIGAVKCANTWLTAFGGGELSMSWGGGETDAHESAFLSANKIVYFASSGDTPGISWPSTSPKVVSVGGTTISRAFPSYNFLRHAAWPDAGEGASEIFARPSYQQGVAGISGTKRVTPDISAIANPDTGVWVWFGDPHFPSDNGWYVVGGTSVASPVVAGITNARGAFRLNSTVELASLYGAKKINPSLFATTTAGFCGPYAAYVPDANWNFCLGLGTIRGLITPLVATQ